MEHPGTPTRDVEEYLTNSHLVCNQESHPAIIPHGRKLTGETSLDAMEISENSSKTSVKGKNTFLMKSFSQITTCHSSCPSKKSAHMIFPSTSLP
jgi:hypothetical protein